MQPKDIVPSRYMTETAPVSEEITVADNELYAYFSRAVRGSITKWSHYFSIYHKHLARFKNTPVVVLEIGVFKGESLRMWKSFLGERCTVFGVDNDERCTRFADPDNNIHVVIGDQGDPVFLRKLMEVLPTVDVLIDDGGHMASQQITTFLECYDKISENGVYICEDLHTNYWPDFQDAPETFVDFAKRHVDYLNAWFFDGENKGFNVPYGQGEIPLFTNITHSVTFYNSVIVFEKSRAERPVALF
jgi:Cephalosporin hydroxylase.